MKSKLLLLVGLMSFGFANAITISPITSTMPIGSNSTSITLDNSKSTKPYIVSTKIVKWVASDKPLHLTEQTSIIEDLSNEEMELFIVNKPVREMNKPVKYTTRIVYRGDRGATQKTYRVLINPVEIDVNSTSISLDHRLPLFIEPVGEVVEKLDVQKKNGVITIKNVGNVTYRAKTITVDGKEFAPPYMLPNSVWYVEGKDIEIGDNNLRN